MQTQDNKNLYRLEENNIEKYQVPDNWTIYSLSDLCKIRKHNSIESELYIGLEHIGQGTNRLESNGNVKDFTSTKNVFLKGDVLYGKLRPLLNKVWLASENGYCSTDILPLVPNDKIVNVILMYILCSSRFVAYATSRSSGTKMPRINWTDVMKFKVLLAPLVEQQRIASILSQVDSLIQKTDEIIEQTQRLKKGLVQTLLRKGISHTIFKKINNRLMPESWEIRRLGEFSESYRYPTFYDIQYQRVGIPVLNIGNIDSETWKLSIRLDDYQKIDQQTSLRFNKTILEEGDLVLAVRGATIGKLAVVPRDLSSSNINANLLKIKLRKEICSPYYFWYYCQSEQGRKDFKKFISSTAKETIQAGKLKQWEIPLPPLKEQHRITEIVRSAEITTENQITYRNAIYKLKRGLMQKLLTGKIRVKV